MLYYIDISSQPLVKEFIPRVPENRMPEEDAEIERICLAKTLEGCFSASSELEGLFSRHKFKPDEIFRLYIFDEDDIKEGNLTDSEVLWHDELVPDAYLTGEVWIENQNLIPKEVKYFSVNDLKYRSMAMLSFQEFTEFDEEFHISEIFETKENILVEDFIKLTEIRPETKTSFYDMEIHFYNNNELLFPEIEPIYDEEKCIKLNNFQVLNLSKYFPNIEDFRDVKRRVWRELERFGIDFTDYEFFKDGIEFRYGCPVLCKEKFLKIFIK